LANAVLCYGNIPPASKFCTYQEIRKRKHTYWLANIARKDRVTFRGLQPEEYLRHLGPVTGKKRAHLLAV